MEHHPKPPSLAITIFGVSGFLAAVLGAVLTVVAIIVLIADGEAARPTNVLGGVALALLGLGGFRLARAMEAGQGFYLASAAIITFGLIALVALMPLGDLQPAPGQMFSALTLLVFAAAAGGSLHEGRAWFAIDHAPRQRPARAPRRLTITLGGEPTPPSAPRTAKKPRRQAPRTR